MLSLDTSCVVASSAMNEGPNRRGGSSSTIPGITSKNVTSVDVNEGIDAIIELNSKDSRFV